MVQYSVTQMLGIYIFLQNEQEVYKAPILAEVLLSQSMISVLILLMS